MSGYRCLHLPHISPTDVFQPTALIVFALKITISLAAKVVAEQGLMQRSGASYSKWRMELHGIVQILSYVSAVYRYTMRSVSHAAAIIEGQSLC